MFNTLIKFKKSYINFVILFVKYLALKSEVCGSRDLFVLKNRLIQLFRGTCISLISRPYQMNLKGLTCLIGTLSNFPLIYKIAIFFYKCVKNLPVQKIRMLMFFQAGRAPLMTLIPRFNKCCALPNFYLKKKKKKKKKKRVQ